MLTRIDIQGLAIIDYLSIEFSQGFNVITGETGAGKSILIKALSLLLGAKASSDTVRRGKDNATVTGHFEVPQGHRSTYVLKEFGIIYEDPTEETVSLLVRRSITNKGRSMAWVNDVPVTVTVLRDLAACLIDVFGQHDNLRLLDASQHIHYVDLFLEDPDITVEYRDSLRETNTLLNEFLTLIETVHTKRRDVDYLVFRCEELKKFAASEDDYNRVKNICHRGAHAFHLAQGLEKARSAIDQGADGEPISRLVWESSRILTKLEPLTDYAKPLADEASKLAARLDDLSFQIGKAITSVEMDEGTLEEAQARLAGYQDMFRKLMVNDIEGLIQEEDRLRAELELTQTASSQVLALLKRLKSISQKTADVAVQLTKARFKAKDIVRKRLSTELKELAMPEASVDVEFLPLNRILVSAEVDSFGSAATDLWRQIANILTSLGEHGAERAQFILATNKGETMLPLQKIASGGEISRVMLALKKALAAGADSCILVFDEIDSGISGRVADIVGRKMRELAANFQVICISHLAQVAAYADNHFLVHKFGRGDRTESTITSLSRNQSEEEVARLLSGDEVTETSLANAKALIRKARTGRENQRHLSK